ncbi:biopolymer transporter ExbD [bacterium]|nr:biopolymer transporter ExbD [bacterium]
MARLKRHEIPETTGINMTPLIDVVFQLLLFFMLASSLIRPNKIELDLPESTSGVKASATPTLDVTYLWEQGQALIALNGEQLPNLEELGAKMKDRDAGQPEEVSIRIQKDVPYQDVVSVIDTVRDAGYPKFSLHTLAAGSAPPPAPISP